jgi:enoyl-CoA hydratase/carnithine racemase
MPVVEWKKEGYVAILTMTNGENRHNPTFIKEILAAFDEIEADDSIRAVILASNDPKNWSQGIDLDWIMGVVNKQDLEAIKGFMYGLNKIFSRILLYPMPVIAQINGHTFGDGVMLACACDFRFMKSDRGYFCLPEVDINIPLLPGMQAVVKKAMPYYKFTEIVLTGKRCGAVELEKDHVIVKACADAEELRKETLAFAQTFNKQRPIFGEIKYRKHKQILDVFEKDDPPYIEKGELLKM